MFIICWAPYYCYSIYRDFFPDHWRRNRDRMNIFIVIEVRQVEKGLHSKASFHCALRFPFSKTNLTNMITSPLSLIVNPLGPRHHIGESSAHKLYWQYLAISVGKSLAISLLFQLDTFVNIMSFMCISMLKVNYPRCLDREPSNKFFFFEN